MNTMEKCIRCKISENQVKLFDVIYEGKVESICERCSIVENLPVIVKPTVSQIKDSERGFKVLERMKRLAGIKNEKKQEDMIKKNRLEELRKNPDLESPEKNKIELVDHFNWEIMRARRRRGFTQKHLAEVIGEPELNITNLEKGSIPPNPENLVKKIEQFLRIRIRKISPFELIRARERKEPVLLDENGNVLEKIPEPEINLDEDLLSDEESENEKNESSGKKFFGNIFKKLMNNKESSEEEENLENISSDAEEDEDFDLNKVDINSVKVGDLKELHKKKIEATKPDKIEEQKKIEARQKLIEARREELRLMRDRKSKDIDNVLGGTELLKKR